MYLQTHMFSLCFLNAVTVPAPSKNLKLASLLWWWLVLITIPTMTQFQQQKNYVNTQKIPKTYKKQNICCFRCKMFIALFYPDKQTGTHTHTKKYSFGIGFSNVKMFHMLITALLGAWPSVMRSLLNYFGFSLWLWQNQIKILLKC